MPTRNQLPRTRLNIQQRTPKTPAEKKLVEKEKKALASKERHAEMTALNPSVDRSAVKVYQPDRSKATISLVHDSSGNLMEVQYPYVMDWSDKAAIRALNEWRCYTFYYWLGPVTKRDRAKHSYIQEEKVWVFRAGEEHMPWAEVEAGFNEKFEGRLLEGCDTKRPRRGEKSLANFYHRLRAKDWTPDVSDGQEITLDGDDSDLEEGEIREEVSVGDPWRNRPWEL